MKQYKFCIKNKSRLGFLIGILTILLIIIFIIPQNKKNKIKDQLLDFKSGKITILSLELAKEIRKDNGGVHYSENSPINKITSITPEVFNALIADPDGPIYISLNGLTDISSETLKGLTAYSISFNGLKTISPEVSKILVNSNSLYLKLRGIELISDESAKELAKYKGYIIGNEYLNKRLTQYHYSLPEE